MSEKQSKQKEDKAPEIKLEKKLGKIESAHFGLYAPKENGIGIYFKLSGQGWAVDSGIAFWDSTNVLHNEKCEWTEENRNKEYANIVRTISGLLAEAKVHKVESLKGIPIEASFDGSVLKTWRILTEVL